MQCTPCHFTCFRLSLAAAVEELQKGVGWHTVGTLQRAPSHLVHTQLPLAAAVMEMSMYILNTSAAEVHAQIPLGAAGMGLQMYIVSTSVAVVELRVEVICVVMDHRESVSGALSLLLVMQQAATQQARATVRG